MASDESTIVATSVAGSTLVYFEEVRSGIRELNITGSPDTAAGGQPQTATLNPSVIATADSHPPLSIGSVAVSGASVDGVVQPLVHVFYTDHPGSPDQGTTISSIAYMTRDISDASTSWPVSMTTDTQARLPLGGSESAASAKSSSESNPS